MVKDCIISDRQEIIEKIERYICEHLDEKISLAHLVSRFQLSGTSIKLLFKAHFDEPVYAHIRRLKIERAALLLRETDNSVLAVAGMVGYENGSKFAKVFRGAMGMNPKKYRDSFRKK